MTTIPKEERAAATTALNEVKGWLGQADYKAIADELGDCTAATVRAVAKSERFTAHIYTALLRLGRAKRDSFRSTLDAGDKKASSRMPTPPDSKSAAKSPEIAPATPAINFPEKGIKPRAPRKKTEKPETPAVA